MTLLDIKKEIRNGGFGIADLDNLIAFVKSVQTDQAKDSVKVGDNVWVIQKTKRTPGVVTKINIKKALVDMRGSTYRVPLSMLEVQ
jgi:FKBP-type peptidyl-prolyl cis-trans isomerase 2